MRSTVILLVLGLAACSSSGPSDGGAQTACVPGQSVACVGIGGCAGGQVCNATGTSFEACQCGPFDGGGDGGPLDGGGDSGPIGGGDGGMANGCLVQFVQPALTTTTPSPVAAVMGTSPLQLHVTGCLAPINAVQVTSDSATDVLAQWRGASVMSGQATFTQSIVWDSAVGAGLHHLTATVSDISGDTASATLDVEVACETDADCSGSAGTRCCPADGVCHMMVDPDADCDCAHPCPLDQACLPGTCGQTPQQCRPGCNPGTPSVPAAICASQPSGPDGALQPTYCNTLPADQATIQNMGGACALGDACDITQQNCANLPIDRTQPVSTTNPAVPQTCAPVGPRTNSCMPAGAIALWGTGCTQTCGDTTTDCVQGALCVTPMDQNENPTGPSVCRAQCNLSEGGGGGFPMPSADCPPNHNLCQIFFGNGMVYYSTGVCVDAAGN